MNTKIKQIAETLYPPTTNASEYVAFLQGAEFAKETMLKKACEYFEDIDFASDYFFDADDFFDNEILINDFKKAMEE